MKKVAKVLITIFIIVISMATIGVTANASEAEIPKKEYIRNGVTYRMNSQLLSEADPDFNEYLLKVSRELFGEEPIIYIYVIDKSLDTLYGFQETYDDGSRSIYLKTLQTYCKAIQVFVHEMVHYKYDSNGAIFYKQDIHGRYVYRNLMEQITDEIARREYSKLTKDVIYQKSYTSEIFEKIIEEDKNDILISLYKGEYLISNNKVKEEVLTYLSELQSAVSFEEAERAFKNLEEKLERCPKYGYLFQYKRRVIWRVIKK